METVPLRLMKDRRYELLPVDRIEVLNSRDREEDRFLENVKSIETVGLLKPILVNGRFLAESGKYELVCGQGRLLAHLRLGKAEIPAEIIDCDRKDAYLMSLIENIARVPPESMWFAREIKRMHDEGMPPAEISRIVGKPEAHVLGYVRLVEKGEERLIRGVEIGSFPIGFALQVAESDEVGTQKLLMDAFDSGVVTTANLRRVRSIIKARHEGLRAKPEPGPSEAGGAKKSEITVQDLKRDLAQSYQEKQSFIRETARKEGRLVSLVEGLKALRSDGGFLGLLEQEGLSELPVLQGPHRIDVNGQTTEVMRHG